MKLNLQISAGLLALLMFSGSLNAQDGVLDVSFGNNGIVRTISTHEAFDMAIQNDGKIIVAGSIYMGSGNDDMAVARYNADGSLDNSFGSNGIVNIDFNGGNDDASSVAIQSDGKIVIAGRAQNASNNNSDIAVIRLNSDGSPDNSFATTGKYQLDVDGYAFDYALDIALHTDGKIVLVAMAGTDMFAKTAIIRLNTNGTLDNTFDGDGIIKPFSFGSFTLSSLYAVTIQSDGKILIGGSKNNNFAVARLNSDGSLDNIYGADGIYSSTTPVVSECKLELQNDGKLVATYSSASQNEVRMVRINSNGIEDAAFGVNGTVITQISSNTAYPEFSKGIVIQPDGKIIVAGSSYTTSFDSDYLVIRYNSDGSIDNSFGTSGNGIVTTSVEANDDDRGKVVKLQSDGKIVVAGSSCIGSCDFVLLRYNNTSGTSGINNSSTTSEFKIFPNPNNGQFSIQIERGGVFELMDITGKVLNTYTIKNTNHIINEKLSPGLYFIRETESHTATKIIIE